MDGVEGVDGRSDSVPSAALLVAFAPDSAGFSFSPVVDFAPPQPQKSKAISES